MGALSSRLEEALDLRREAEVRVGETRLGVRGERQAHFVPAVDEDVRVVVGLLGERCHAVDEVDRGGEVLELQIALDRRRPPDLRAGPVPLAGACQALLYLRVAERGCHR